MTASNARDPHLETRIAGLSAEKREYLKRLLHDKPQGAAQLGAIPKRRWTETAPLSYAQQRMWLLAQFTKDSPFYNESFSLDITFPLDVAVLERAVNEIIRRHEVLRTGFRVENGVPVQVICPSLKLPLKAIDLRSVSVIEREAKAWDLARREALRPFDLNRDLPFMRAMLIRLAERRHLFLLTMHHIICDGWSMGVFSQELSILYDAMSRGLPSPLPDLPVQYDDFAVWQRNALAGDALNEQLEYWRKQLKGLPTLELPTDKPRPPMQSFAGGRVSIVIAPHIYAALKKMSAELGVTLFMTLLAAFQVLLHRYTGQDDIVVGVPVANRTRAELEGMIGFFVNALVMRTDVSGDPTFHQLLYRVRTVAAAAFANQDVPFEKLVEELQPKRDVSRNPLFQVAFQLFAGLWPSQASSRPQMTLDSIEIGTAKFDLRFDLYETDRGLDGVLEYCSDLFEKSTIERVSGHYQTLLASVVENCNTRISELPILTETERVQLLETWNRTEAEYPLHSTVHELVEAQARHTPEALAVASRDRRLSYRELDQRANELASYLRSLGVGPDDVVAVCAHRSVESIAGLLGILKAGGAYLPMDPAYPPERLAYMLEDSQAAVLLTQERVLPFLPRTRVPTLCLDTEWNKVLAAKSRAHPNVSPRCLAYVIYTSGSTGRPRGVEIEHHSLMNLVTWHQREYRPGVGDRATHLAGPGFDASVWELWPYLSCGAAILIPDERTIAVPSQLWQWLASERITHTFIPTPLAENMLQEPASTEPLRLRALLTGGDKLHKAPEQLFPFRFINHYGPTENTVVTTFATVETGAKSSQPPPIGRPISNTKLYVLDHHRNLAPIGIPGELYISGVGLARGYRNRPDLTSERFVENCFGEGRLYRSGDMVRWLSNGNLEFIGRTDNQVKLRGFRVELGEIECALRDYVAPKQRPAIEPQSSGRRLSGEHVARWNTLYDQTYQQPAPVADPEFNIVGWNSSYTGSPLPASDMQEQVDHTVSRILALEPKHALEIGCGTGLLLLRVAPHCASYTATDFSATAINSLRPHVATYSHVRLFQKLAHDFSEFASGSFDTIVLNSVIQYFPSVDYLMEVLNGALELLSPGGRIFIGDVRSLELLPYFHTSVELFQAPKSLGTSELRERIRRRAEHEQELVIHPALFTQLRDNNTRIITVDLQLRRGSSDNEIVRYRYDVMLQVGSPAVEVDCERCIDWSDIASFARLREILTKHGMHSLRVDHISNRRIWEDYRAHEILNSAACPPACRALKTAAASGHSDTIDPEAIWRLGEECGWDIQIGYSDVIQCFDVLFRRKQPDLQPVVNWGMPTADQSLSCTDLANNPLAQEYRRNLVVELRDALRHKLPEYMIPSSFVIVDSLPLTPNGKLDRQALPSPGGGRPELEAVFVPPRSELERSIAAMWQDLLGIEEVGIHDNFFDLGGHSLLIVRLHRRLSDELDADLSLTDLFRYPTVASLAQHLTGEAQAPMLRDDIESRAAAQKAALVRKRKAVDASAGVF
jgi:amino acid adenylation domain-containing protein